MCAFVCVSAAFDLLVATVASVVLTFVVRRAYAAGKVGDSWSGHVSEFLSLFSPEICFKVTDSLVLIGSSLLPGAAVSGLPAVGEIGPDACLSLPIACLAEITLFLAPAMAPLVFDS